MTRREVLTGHSPVPEWMVAELAALRAALPGYDVLITKHSPTFRFEAIRHDTDRPGPYCVISSDPADLWWELAKRLRPVDAARATRTT